MRMCVCVCVHVCLRGGREEMGGRGQNEEQIQRYITYPLKL